MSRSELVVATGTYDGGPSAPTARSSVADGGFIKSRVALRPVRAAQSDAAPPSYATRSAPTSATIVASRRGDLCGNQISGAPPFDAMSSP